MAKTIPADEKVFMVSKTTNTTYSGSAALKAMNEWYTMDDVTNTVRPYKVYTALLTQSGGDDPTSLSDEPLTIGVTYLIIDQGGSGWDFTNVGAPNNNIGTYFVATGTTPNSWGDLGVSLNFNNGAPVATVLENTIGNVWFTYSDVGSYFFNSNGVFTENKILTYPNNTTSIIAAENSYISIGWESLNQLYLQTASDNDISFNGPLSIEIRVYS